MENYHLYLLDLCNSCLLFLNSSSYCNENILLWCCLLCLITRSTVLSSFHLFCVPLRSDDNPKWKLLGQASSYTGLRRIEGRENLNQTFDFTIYGSLLSIVWRTRDWERRRRSNFTVTNCHSQLRLLRRMVKEWRIDGNNF